MARWADCREYLQESRPCSHSECCRLRVVVCGSMAGRLSPKRSVASGQGLHGIGLDRRGWGWGWVMDMGNRWVLWCAQSPPIPGHPLRKEKEKGKSLVSATVVSGPAETGWALMPAQGTLPPTLCCPPPAQRVRAAARRQTGCQSALTMDVSRRAGSPAVVLWADHGRGLQ